MASEVSDVMSDESDDSAELDVSESPAPTEPVSLPDEPSDDSDAVGEPESGESATATPTPVNSAQANPAANISASQRKITTETLPRRTTLPGYAMARVDENERTQYVPRPGIPAISSAPSVFFFKNCSFRVLENADCLTGGGWCAMPDRPAPRRRP